MKNKHLNFRKYRVFLMFVWCTCCSIYVYAQNVTLPGRSICEGETVNFDNLIGGVILDELDGWYVDNQNVSADLYGFTAKPAVTTTYTLRFVSRSYNITITVYETPDLVIPGDRDICSGEDVYLDAHVTNPTPYTQIQWQWGMYDNYSTIYPSNIGKHTLTATAKNAPQCPPVTKEWHVTAIFNPSTAYIESSAATHCSKSTIDLDKQIIFFVSGPAGRDTAETTSGTILWYSDYYYSTPVPDPEHVTLSLRDTMFYADLSGVTVSYSKTCDGKPFQQTLTGNRQAVSINVNSDDFAFDYGYSGMCFGDSVYAKFQLRDETSSPSQCDIIDRLDVLSSHTPEREIITSPAEQTLVFAPFAGLTDTIKIKATSKNGLEKEFKLFLRTPTPVSISPETACINTPGYFTVMVDQCDSIENIVCSITGTATDEKLATNQWRMRTPDLPDDTPFTCTVTYYSKLYDKDSTETLNSTLTVWKDPPQSMIYSMWGDTRYGFDSNSQNLCLGDSLLFTFYTPYSCDTIIDVKITDVAKQQSAGTPSYQDKHNHQFIIKPTAEGAYSYTALVHYKRPKETIIREEPITYTVQVKQRPRMLVDNPAITPRCYSDIPNDPKKDPPLDLADPNSPAYGVINYTFVEPGTARFYNTNTPTFTPSETGHYLIGADYKYMCSEMTGTQVSENVYIVVSNRKDDGSAYINLSSIKDFCDRDGITIESLEKPGSNLTWKHNGDIIPPFPYRPAAGTYDLTLEVKNACYPDDPYTHTVTVTVVPQPKVEAIPDNDEYCRNETVELKVEPGHIGDLTWTQSSSGNPVSNPVTIYETTTFTVHAYNAACGEATDEVTIFRMPDAAVQVIPDTSVCKYDEIRLRATRNEGNITWSGGPLSQSLEGESPAIVVTADETYVATATNRCSQATDAVTVWMLEIPSVKVTHTDTVICHGETLDFNACIASATGRLQWEPNNNTGLIEPARYVVTATTDARCGEAKDTLYLNIYKPLILLPNNSHLPEYNKQDVYDLSFQTLQAEPELTYSISGTLPPGLKMMNDRLYGRPELGPRDYNTHRFEISVTDGHRCKTSKEYILNPKWKAANVFLPMSSTIDNTVFLPGYDLEIYNRNGLLVHKGMGWDGRWNSVYTPAGTYFYKVKITVDSKPEERMGFAVIMYY